MMQPDRVVQVRERYLARGAAAGLPETFSAELFELLIAATCRLEDELMDRLRPREGRGGGVSLPPGPRLPRALQAVGWTQRPLPYLERCRRRYGDAFTLRIMHWGDWVSSATPPTSKRSSPPATRSASTSPTRCSGRSSARAR